MAGPDAGRRLKAWALEAGFDQVTATGSVWCYASAEDLTWWTGTWAERLTASTFATSALTHSLADRDELVASLVGRDDADLVAVTLAATRTADDLLLDGRPVRAVLRPEGRWVQRRVRQFVRDRQPLTASDAGRLLALVHRDAAVRPPVHRPARAAGPAHRLPVGGGDRGAEPGGRSRHRRGDHVPR